MRERTPHTAAPRRRARAKQLLAWVFAAVALVLLARLIWVGLRFAWWLISWLAEGNVLARLEIGNPLSLAVNVVLVVLLITVGMIAKHEQAKSDT